MLNRRHPPRLLIDPRSSTFTTANLGNYTSCCISVLATGDHLGSFYQVGGNGGTSYYIINRRYIRIHKVFFLIGYDFIAYLLYPLSCSPYPYRYRVNHDWYYYTMQ